MPRVEIIEKKEIFKRFFFRIQEARFRHEKLDGSMSDEMTRLSFERGDAVAGIMHNPLDDTLILIEQFRYPALDKDRGWLIELPAGVVETGENPEETMRREIEEETGYRAAILHHLHTFFLSPGGSSERIFLYYSRIDPSDRISEGGGLDEENEDIRVMRPTVDKALDMMTQGEIVDAKTIIALQWLQLNRDKLPG